jgi:hypothetical protein
VNARNRIGIQTVPQRDIAIHLAHAEARGIDLPVTAATPMLYTQLEHKMAAVMQGKPYGWSRTRRAWTCPGDRNTFWRVASSRGGASRKGRSGNSRAIIKIIRGVKFTDGCEVIAKPGDLQSQTAAA